MLDDGGDSARRSEHRRPLRRFLDSQERRFGLETESPRELSALAVSRSPRSVTTTSRRRTPAGKSKAPTIEPQPMNASRNISLSLPWSPGIVPPGRASSRSRTAARTRIGSVFGFRRVQERRSGLRSSPFQSLVNIENKSKSAVRLPKNNQTARPQSRNDVSIRRVWRSPPTPLARLWSPHLTCKCDIAVASVQPHRDRPLPSALQLSRWRLYITIIPTTVFLECSGPRAAAAP